MHEALKPRSSIESLRDPVLIAAFAGWNDNGGGAVATMAYLVEQWGATELADIDPHEFYDFTVEPVAVDRVSCHRGYEATRPRRASSLHCQRYAGRSQPTHPLRRGTNRHGRKRGKGWIG